MNNPDAPSDRTKTGLTPYLTAAQVADLLQVDTTTVYRWAATDATMPAMRVHGAVRFDAILLNRWLASRTQRSRRQICHQSGESTIPGTSA